MQNQKSIKVINILIYKNMKGITCESETTDFLWKNKRIKLHFAILTNMKLQTLYKLTLVKLCILLYIGSMVLTHSWYV